MRNPGRLLQSLAAHRNGALSESARAAMVTPAACGFWATVVCEAAHESLSAGSTAAEGVVDGRPVDVSGLLKERVGNDARLYTGE
jgi:hypothetical protein